MDTVLLRRVYVLIFVEHDTRRLHIGGVTTHPSGVWVTQQARNLAMDLGTRMDTLRFLIRDRDTKFVDAFDAVFRAADIQIITTPPQAPRANAICERLVGTLAERCSTGPSSPANGTYGAYWTSTRPTTGLTGRSANIHPRLTTTRRRPPTSPPTASAEPPSWADSSTSTTTPPKPPGQPPSRVFERHTLVERVSTLA